MLEIRPFKGTFFRTGKVGDYSRVVSPPYDVINEDMRREFLRSSPYNIVRLILPEPGEKEFWNRSASLFRAWKEEGILHVDTTPAFYVHAQTFSLPGGDSRTRTGLIALLKCVDFPGGDVLPHEKTFHRTLAERLNLLRACRANFSQVFTVFRDAEGEVEEVLAGVKRGFPWMEFRDREGVVHRLWRLADAAAVEKVRRILAPRKLIIADGHHRYETALRYSREAGGWSSRYVPVTLFRSEDPGLVVLPVHRLLRRFPFTLEEAVEKLRGFLRVVEVRGNVEEIAAAFTDSEDPSSPRYALLCGEGGVLLSGDGDKGFRPKEGGRRREGLDIVVLHELILKRALGLPVEAMAERRELYFCPWKEKVLQDLREGRAEASFLVRPTSMEDIWMMAETGERMPHKSSYFYPKLPSGLVIYDHLTGL